ncbi:MAG: 3-oxoacyl-[acyl-carrier protein] reductase [Algoriphagus sp.]|jgi:3-oxoacyl-[acyl-carrier protein] reductase
MNRVALVTGGSRGIGFGIAKKLAQEGIDLAINGVRAESDADDSLAELRSFGVRVEYVQGDIGTSEGRKGILQGLRDTFGAIDILVNNAGVAPKVRSDVFEISEEDYDYVVDINQKGTFFLTQAIAKWMAEAKQANPERLFTIITVTSVSAVMASIHRASYCMSKAAASIMSTVMAIKMAEFDIPVYEIRPGVIETDMIEAVRESYHKAVKSGFTLEQRMGMPEDIGKVAAALVRGDLPYSTGQIISVDGGMTVQRM